MPVNPAMLMTPPPTKGGFPGQASLLPGSASTARALSKHANARSSDGQQEAGSATDPISLFARLIDELDALTSSTAAEGNPATAVPAPPAGGPDPKTEGEPTQVVTTKPGKESAGPPQFISLSPEPVADTSAVPPMAAAGTAQQATNNSGSMGFGIRTGRQERRVVSAGAALPERDGIITVASTAEIIRVRPQKELQAKGDDQNGGKLREAVVAAGGSPPADDSPQVLGSPAALEVRLRAVNPELRQRDENAASAELMNEPPPRVMPEVRPMHVPNTAIVTKPLLPDEAGTGGSKDDRGGGDATVPQLQPRNTFPHVTAEIKPEPPPLESRPEAQPAPKAAPEPAPAPEDQAAKSHQQTLRSLALEFTPDGAHDVRVRVAERAGSVHISVHSPDDSLNGRLREGVHDLVGSLSTAGYEADAWTPEHRNSQHNSQENPQQQGRNRRQFHAGSEEFTGLIDQQKEEIL